MPNKPNFYQLFQLMGEVHSDVKGINSRLDRMNGSIKSHDEKIDVLESCKDQMKDKSAAYGLVGGAIVTGIGFLISWFK